MGAMSLGGPVLVAPSAFKGTLAPHDAAAALAEGVADALPGVEILTCPLADGGDGTADVLVDHLAGERVVRTVTGPLGAPVLAAYGRLPGGVVVVDMAAASGLALLAPGDRDAAGATSRGTGELVAAALGETPARVLIGVGGSASSDGGGGIAQALGIRLLDAAGHPVPPGARGLLALDRIDGSSADPRLAGVELVVACDVDNPLLGPAGAARVFAPQKGATPAAVRTIERGLERFAAIVACDAGIDVGGLPRGGAAGGAAAGMHALLGAELHEGFALVADMLGFQGLLERSALLIVGEGSLDAQSLRGKAPVAAARRAWQLGIPVWAFAGRVTLGRRLLADNGIDVDVDLTELMGAQARRDPAGALRHVASRMLRRAFDGPAGPW
jgi:glycerate kinase